MIVVYSHALLSIPARGNGETRPRSGSDARGGSKVFNRLSAANKPTYAVGGAFGGPTPDGSAVVAHLYVEYGALPSYMTYEKIETEEGERIDLSSEQRVTRHDRIREVQATIHLTPEVAIALAQWLVQNAQIALKRRGGN